MINKNDSEILDRIKTTLLPTGVVESIILFGSRAYGNFFNDQSDYDILIVTNELCDWKKQDQIYDILYDLQLEFNTLFDIHFLDRSEINTLRGKQPIYQKALSEGIFA